MAAARLAGFMFAKTAAPEPLSDVQGPSPGPDTVAATAQATIRETIDLLELDLGVAIRAVGHAADTVQ
jgi:hypothetical protein